MFFGKQAVSNGFAPVYNIPVFCPEIFVHVTNRKMMINKDDVPQKLAFKKFKPEYFGLPTLVNIDASTTGRELYELVWMRVRYMLKQSATENTDMLWWRHTDQVNLMK